MSVLMDQRDAQTLNTSQNNKVALGKPGAQFVVLSASENQEGV